MLIFSRRVCRLLLYFCLLSGIGSVLTIASIAPAVAAQTAQVDSVAERGRQVEEETAALARDREALDKWRGDLDLQRTQLDVRKDNALLLQEAQLGVESAKVRLESAQLDQAAATRRLSDLEGRAAQLDAQISKLRKALDNPSVAQGTQQALDAALDESKTLQQLLPLERRHAANLQGRQSVAEQRLGLAKSWYESVDALQQQYQATSRREAMQDLEKRLNSERDALLAKATALRDTVPPAGTDEASAEADRSLLDSRIKQAEEKAFLLQVRLDEAHARENLVHILAGMPTDNDEQLASLGSELGELIAELTPLRSLLQDKLSLIRQQQALNEKRQALNPVQQRTYRQAAENFQQLAKDFQIEQEQLVPLIDEIGRYANQVNQAISERMRQGLRNRHTLPRSMDAWTSLLSELVMMPAMLGRVIGEVIGHINQAVFQASNDALTLYLFLLLCWGLLWLWTLRSVNHLYLRWSGPREGHSFLLQVGRFFSEYWRQRRFGLWPAAIMLLAVWVLDVPQRSARVIMVLVGLWLVTTFIYSLARWLLVGHILDEQNRRPDLYRAFRRTLIFSAVLTAIVALAHLGFVSLPLREIIDRFFLPFLMVPGVLSLRIRTHVMALLGERVQHGLWYETIRFSTLAVPLLLFVAALFGLIGFINLAWYVTAHLAGFLLVFASWLVVVSLLNDLANLAKNYVNLRTNTGLIWAKGVIEPLAYLAFVGTLFLAGWFLFHLFGWGADTLIVTLLGQVLAQPLFTIGQTAIDLKHVLGTLLLLVAVVFGAHWIRQFTYRWLYAGVLDLGIRNSLSVFTQYAFVLIGLLIALNVLGVNLTSLAIFAGALGVGIGFGLQNIANNFISGLILLAERPIRTSDWVTIGANEGEVKRIGIRAVTVTTWDNQDVVIPNAEIITTPFINWTLSDDIVRTVIFMGISYNNDPHQAMQVIRDAVQAYPAVLKEPPCRVWLREFGNSSVDFRIHYHINVRLHSRLEVKSEVMLRIWDALKEAGISIPFPQQDVYIKELPERR